MDDGIVEHVMETLNSWRKDGINCDATLLIGGQEFHAHKNILAAAIGYFEKLFTGDFAEKGKNAITLKDVDPEGFRLILNYIYTGEIDINDDNFGQVLFLAAYYQIEYLIEKLFDYVTGNICTDNAFFYYCSADFVEIELIKGFVKKFIQKDFLSCSNSNAFLDITHSSLLEFIDSPVKYEVDKFKIIMKWIEQDVNKRFDYFSDLIKHVCFAYISSDEILNDILDYQLVINNPEIIKAIKQSKNTKHTMKIYKMIDLSLIRLDIIDAKLHAKHALVETKVNFDEFQIVSSADAMYISIFKKGEGNKLCSYKNSKWMILDNSAYTSEEANRSIVYLEKYKTIYVNKECYISSYNLESKSYSCSSANNYRDNDSRIQNISGSLVCYNDFIYTTGLCVDGNDYIFRYDPLRQRFLRKSQLLKRCSNAVNVVLDDKMFIVSSGHVYVYDITQNRCTLMSKNQENSSTRYHSLIGYQNRLYAIRETWDIMDVFDLLIKTWIKEVNLI